ncbi:MAG: hypothetical protein IKN04_00205 [Clostridia bacterium]|nr:hypothetical protein [Clostridia bacterium]MBR6185432.1 hypothetical protein [Clostridia bacterium]
MSNKKFIGVIAYQNYRWGYTCEFCGRTVEKQDKVSVQEGGMYKVTTHAYASRFDVETMKNRAIQQLAVSVADMDQLIQQGHFKTPNDSGACPFCKKYQHWSFYVTNARNKSDRDSRAESGCMVALLTAFVGPIVGVLLALLTTVLIPNVKELSSQAKTLSFVVPLLFGVLGTFLVVRIFANKSSKKENADQKALLKELENVRKTEPYFIAWADQHCDAHGMGLSI